MSRETATRRPPTGRVGEIHARTPEGSGGHGAPLLVAEVVRGIRSAWWVWRSPRRRLKVRSTTDIIGIIALVLLILIFLRVFGII